MGVPLNTPLGRAWLVPLQGGEPRPNCSYGSPHPAPGRAARRPCGSGNRWCPWPPCGSPACCGSTCPENGSTSSTPSPSRGPSPTTASSARTEVRAPSLRSEWGRQAEPPPLPPCAFLRRHPAQQVPLHRRPGGDPAPERVGAPAPQVRCRGQPLPGASCPCAGPCRGQERGAGRTALVPPRRPPWAADGTGGPGLPCSGVCIERCWWALGGAFRSQGHKTASTKAGTSASSHR